MNARFSAAASLELREAIEFYGEMRHGLERPSYSRLSLRDRGRGECCLSAKLGGQPPAYDSKAMIVDLTVPVRPRRAPCRWSM